MAFRYRPGMASLSDIDYRTRIGSAAWFRRHGPAAQWLSSWRFGHTAKVAGGAKTRHGPIRSYARSKGLKPSSLLTTKENLTFAAKKLGKAVKPNATTTQIGKVLV